jgi:DNA-binding response OmpR family regulator
MPYRILIVEDDPNLSVVLSGILAASGFNQETAADGISAIAKATEDAFDLILLDVGLPDQSGFAVCRQLRDRGVDTPILLLSGRAETSDKIEGLRSGADDYVTKPFDVDELLARIQALLRRSVSRALRSLTEHRFADVYVDFLHGTVVKGGAALNVSGRELHLLRHLIARRPHVVSREELLTEVWGYRSSDTRTVDVHVAAVRRKLEDDQQQPRHIVTERGKGYRFCG